MRRFVVALVTAALAGAGAVTAATLAAAPPGPVGAVHVSPSMDNAGTSYVTITWASNGADSDGSLVCVQPGRTPPRTPHHCESRIAVDPPGRSSGLIPLRTRHNYTFSVFSYKGTSPITYGEPVSAVRHGIKVSMTSSCPSTSAGSRCSIRSLLVDNLTDKALGGRTLELWTSRGGKSWSRLTRANTDGTGHAKTTVTLDHSRFYQWRYATSRTRELNSTSAQLHIVVTH